METIYLIVDILIVQLYLLTFGVIVVGLIGMAVALMALSDLEEKRK